LEDEKTLVPVGTTWNYQLVVQHMFRDEISKQMEKTGLKSTDKGWIKEFQSAVNNVIQSEGGEAAVMEKYGDMAKSWNEVEPPEEIKRK
jgi:hypothetical protein